VGKAFILMESYKCSLKVSSVNMRLMYEDLKSAGVAIAGEPASGGNIGIAY
jgi:hypothetical protein